MWMLIRLVALLVIFTRGTLGQCSTSCTGCTSCSDCVALQPCYWFPNNPTGQKCLADNSGAKNICAQVPTPAPTPPPFSQCSQIASTDCCSCTMTNEPWMRNLVDACAFCPGVGCMEKSQSNFACTTKKCKCPNKCPGCDGDNDDTDDNDEPENDEPGNDDFFKNDDPNNRGGGDGNGNGNPDPGPSPAEECNDGDNDDQDRDGDEPEGGFRRLCARAYRQLRRQSRRLTCDSGSMPVWAICVLAIIFGGVLLACCVSYCSGSCKSATTSKGANAAKAAATRAGAARAGAAASSAGKTKAKKKKRAVELQPRKSVKESVQNPIAMHTPMAHNPAYDDGASASGQQEEAQRPQQQQQRMMAVQLPPSAVPGMEVQFQAPGGQVLKIMVPTGMQPGQVIQVAY